jgi:peptide/nickel transport system ATP-binding protein
MTILTVSQLRVSICTEKGRFNPVDGVDFTIARGETLALLGESGCGKSLTALALMQLLPPAASITASSHVKLAQENLLALSEAQLQRIRGQRIAMIFQEPMTSLNPIMKIGKQITETLHQHQPLQARVAYQRVIELLHAVGIPDPKRCYHEYPHQLSGGMKQRVVIAMAIACQPELLIADEPTTALDVTIQLQLLQLLKKLQRQTGMGMLFITHDLSVVRQVADRVAVMYAGQIIETATTADFFRQPQHPYSQGLFAALPSLDRQQQLTVIRGQVPSDYSTLGGCRFAARCDYAWQPCLQTQPLLSPHRDGQVRCHLYHHSDPPTPNSQRQADKPAVAVSPPKPSPQTPVLLTVRGLKKYFASKRFWFRPKTYVKAVDGIDFELRAGHTLALVGESGCGKTTTGQLLLALLKASAGQVSYPHATACARDVQMIFQDPYASLNPRWMIADSLAEGIRARALQAETDIPAYLDDLLAKVGLDPSAKFKYPHEFSGGQRQRICIARALSVQPKVVICDEPSSALDVSVQAQILNLLRRLQQQENLAYLFITHDLAVVAYMADEIAVMYHGKIVERGPASRLLQDPKHPYTQALLAAAPKLELSAYFDEVAQTQHARATAGDGCTYHPRCPHAMVICQRQCPQASQLAHGQQVCCHLYATGNGATDSEPLLQKPKDVS